mgnify:CR=1 FL=1
MYSMILHRIADWDDAYANGVNIPGGERWPQAWVEPAKAFRDAAVASGRAKLDMSYGTAPRNRIDLFLHSGDPEVQDAVEEFGDYLLSETLGVSVSWGKKPGAQDFECGGKPCAVDLVKAAAD